MATLQRRVLCIPFPVAVTVLCILLGASLVYGKAIVPEEEAVLLNAKANTPKLEDTEMWAGGADCAVWEGVTCDDDGHVVSIKKEMLSSLEETSSELLAKLPFLENGNSHIASDVSVDKPRRALLDKPEVVSNIKPGERVVVNNALWNERAKDNTIVGYVSMPTLTNPKREFIRLNMSSPAVTTQSLTLWTCNVAPPAYYVTSGAENSGVPSGVVALQLWRGGWFASCSGSLLSPYLVLTAAHCILDTDTNRYFTNVNNQWKVNVRLNGRSDSSYSYVLAYRAVIFQDFVNLNTWSGSLRQGSDLGVIKLSSPLFSRTFRWASPYPSITPRTNYGYPAVTQDGYRLVYDSTTSRQVTGCTGFSSSLMCENVSVEPGMSGGPILNSNLGVVLGTCSGGNTLGCPGYYSGLTGFYDLAILVRFYGCSVSSTFTASRFMYTASCSS